MIREKKKNHLSKN